jgi:alpha-tubulin suppressor-like RCC1 family protein
MSGKFHDGVRVPTRIGESLFNEKSKVKVTKVASGAHHTLALTSDGKIYAWGDPESGKLGRILATRNKDKQALMIEKVGAKDAVDIFAGNHHSFYINSKNQIYAWGLNNHGQLGVGHKENIAMPALVSAISGPDHQIMMIAGGEHHSIAVSREGKVYCWGRNDEGQCGRGDLFGRYKRQKA